MNKKVRVAIKGSEEEAIERAKKYFQDQGFKLYENTGNKLHFKRGNTLLNMVTFNPLKWKSSIRVGCKANELYASFDIDTSFQMVTPKEEALWEGFINNLLATVEGEKDFASINKKLIKDTKNNSLTYVATAFLGAVVVGVPAGVLGSMAGAPGIATYAAIGGAVAFMNHKIRKDRKNNST